MGLEQNEAQQYRESPDKYVEPGGNYQMSTLDYVLRPSTQGVGPITIILPPVSEAKGRFYSILTRAASAVNTVTITDHNDSECWDADIVMNGKCDVVLLYSDGLTWIPCGGEYAGRAATGAPGTATATTLAPTTVATTLAPTS